MQVSSKIGAVVVEDVFRTTPKYLPRQICKDFERDHGVQLTYNKHGILKRRQKSVYMDLHVRPTRICLGYAIG